MDQSNIIEIRDVGKTFPGVTALKSVSFDIKRNSVHCIVGENGAGKSTFIKILTGVIKRSSGEITLNGKPFAPTRVKEAMADGISVLYQELNVVDELTIAENITLGQEEHKYGFPQKSEMLKRAKEILATFDESISLDDAVGSLGVAQKQLVEITKALCSDCSVLVMDEPTAALSLGETRKLFQTVARLKASGVTMIFISHKLSEIFEIGDYVSVFRDGEMVGTRSLEGMDRADLVRMMLGKIVVNEYVPSKKRSDEKLLEVKNVSTRKLKNVSFDLHKGEILGFYGLVGAGKTEVSEILYGHDSEGEIRVKGKRVWLNSVRRALKASIALVPEERRQEGIFGLLGIRQNVPLMRMGTVLKGGLISRAAENKLADHYRDAMSIASSNREHKVGLLSGGNQQKVVIGKCLNRDSDIILMDEPSRGVDIGGKQEIHEIVRDLANDGKSIIVFSSELQEVLQLCDRIVLMYDGEARCIIQNGDDVDTDFIMDVVAGKDLGQ
ncbi:sugar ABC transporter ATP-binding protein [Polycladidibacter stylochi]|uniref:sugar ABC transporter ATP-binding protein n=1 Tax=Polycladidibacter stylochi TaxID=1807766 RepID=UPI000832F6DC|nr:sugar ABC transporter ATP-binding protein [Pseudovibrio stylochi]